MSGSYSRVVSSVEIVLTISGTFREEEKGPLSPPMIVRSAKDSTASVLRRTIARAVSFYTYLRGFLTLR